MKGQYLKGEMDVEWKDEESCGYRTCRYEYIILVYRIY